MRQRDEVKQEKIRRAVFSIVAKEGLAGLSFGKIASAAGVSSGTPYVYYEDKTDMLSKLYIEVKNLLDEGLAQSISQGETLRDQLFWGVFHFAQKYVEYPLESKYSYCISGSPEYVSPEALEHGMYLTAPLVALYERAFREDVLLVSGFAQLNALLFSPMATMLQQSGDPVDLGSVREVVEISVDGVMKRPPLPQSR